MKRLIKILILSVILAGSVWGGIAYHRRQSPAPVNPFQQVAVRRGDLVATISATGTIEPEEVVDVGAQVAGQILTFGKDKNGKPIDYGSAVEAGTVLAQIDDSLYTSDVIQATAGLTQAQANVQRAEADLGQLKAKVEQAENDWNRAQKLGPSDALAKTSYDAYKAAYEIAKANLAVGEATIAQTKGAVLQADAALKRAQRNLGYCTIVSPVEGIIIDRRVNIGQTVVSSLNAPSLFLIAKDLKRMQVWVSVNEADIGSIHSGQAVAFTVDALPGRIFSGKVGKVRLNATMTQNVVTYTVEVVTDNSSGRLLPYLTANVRFEVARRTDVLMAPNAALRWTPAPEQVAPDVRDRLARGAGRQGGFGGAGPAAQSAASLAQVKPGQLWEQDANGLRPIQVRTGLTDGVMTEVEGDELKEGMVVITGEGRAAAPSLEANTNPFTPQFPRGRQGSGGSR
jgi:HlyD family secretion protein